MWFCIFYVYCTLQVKSKGHVENGEVKRKFLFSTWKLTYQNNNENPLGPYNCHLAAAERKFKKERGENYNFFTKNEPTHGNFPKQNCFLFFKIFLTVL